MAGLAGMKAKYLHVIGTRPRRPLQGGLVGLRSLSLFGLYQLGGVFLLAANAEIAQPGGFFWDPPDCETTRLDVTVDHAQWPKFGGKWHHVSRRREISRLLPDSISMWLATHWMQVGRFSEADALLQRVSKGVTEVMGEDHWSTQRAHLLLRHWNKHMEWKQREADEETPSDTEP